MRFDSSPFADMRMRWLAFAIAPLALFSQRAHAQSVVTVFGVVDLNVRHVKNGDSTLNALSPNGIAPSRWGFKGVEDLGDGDTAGFWLEGAILPDTGSQGDPARTWNRRATVSLASPRWGEVRLGRDFTPTYVGYALYDVFGAIGVASVDKFVTTFGVTIDTLNRADNQASYLTPNNLHGVYARMSVAPGEGLPGKRYIGARLGYANETYDISLAASETQVNTSAAGRDQYRMFDVASWYDMGAAKFIGHVTQNKLGHGRLTVTNFGMSIPIGRHTIRASYVRADASGSDSAGVNIDRNDAVQLAVGCIYELSKRTSLYSTVAHIDNKGAASFVVGPPALLPGARGSGRSSIGFESGIRHVF
jgi:predicted porin